MSSIAPPTQYEHNSIITEKNNQGDNQKRNIRNATTIAAIPNNERPYPNRFK